MLTPKFPPGASRGGAAGPFHLTGPLDQTTEIEAVRGMLILFAWDVEVEEGPGGRAIRGATR